MESKTPSMMRDEAIAEAVRTIEYHVKNYGEEVTRTNTRNKWVSDLRNSLPK